MLLTLQRVEPGADGAVTLLGSLAGIAGGAVVAVVGDVGAEAATFSSGDSVVCRDLRIILRQLVGSDCGTARLDRE